MQEPTRFGNYLLLRKLGEDPLGGTYRAARVEGETLGEIVFLRIFSIPVIDASALVASMREYSAVASRLKAPGVTHAIDCGATSGVAYTAYKYFTGWDLKELLRTSNAGFSTLERDHALLVAERIAKGLGVVHQSDPATVRPCHGFLTPQSVMLTSEGEIRLMGFESAPFLAGAMARGQLSADLKSYVSPELRSGTVASAADDIYGLGAILWELLMGEPPSSDGAGMAAELATAKMADGEALPAGLGELLQSSLAAERARTPQAGLWHRQLTDWMTRNEVTTTHFDLAFSVHETFRKRIQKEEIEAEKTISLSPGPPPAAAPEVPVAAAVPGPAPPREKTDGVVPPARRCGKRLLLGIAAVVVTTAIRGRVLTSREPKAPPVAAPPSVEVPAPTPAEPAPSEGLQLAELELKRLVRERAQTVGEQISAEYDAQIRSLREQLREAQMAEAEAMRLAVESAPQPAPPEPVPPVEVGAPPTEPEAPPSQDEAPSTEPQASAAEPQASAAEPEALPREPENRPQETLQPASPPPPVATTTVPPPPAAAPPPPSPPAQAPVVVPPRRKRMPKPVYPARARQLKREATVLLRVLVDTNGKVVEARPVVEKPDPFGFVQSAVRAARNAVFQPATTDGVPTKMWTTVVISFKN